MSLCVCSITCINNVLEMRRRRRRKKINRLGAVCWLFAYCTSATFILPPPPLLLPIRILSCLMPLQPKGGRVMLLRNVVSLHPAARPSPLSWMNRLCFPFLPSLLPSLPLPFVSLHPSCRVVTRGSRDDRMACACLPARICGGWRMD